MKKWLFEQHLSVMLGKERYYIQVDLLRVIVPVADVLVADVLVADVLVADVY